MSNADDKIRIIDLLNKIANGEVIPKKIKFKKYEYMFHNDYNGYYRSVVNSNWIGLTTDFRIIEILNQKVEIIEEQAVKHMNKEEIIDILKEMKEYYGRPDPFKDDNDYDKAVAIKRHFRFI